MGIKRTGIVVALLALALPLAAQGPFGSRTPSMSGIWNPVIGSGGAYEMTESRRQEIRRWRSRWWAKKT